MWILIGGYASDTAPGGIHVIDAATGEVVHHAPRPQMAGYLVMDGDLVHAVDERKTDGRGPVQPPGAVHSLRLDRATGRLDWLCSQRAPGAFPTFLELDPARRLLISASHGSFDHVEHVTFRDGVCQVDHIYDHSTVALWHLGPEGVAGIADLVTLEGHGLDPNSSPQAGGHAQASAHAHCATLDPSGRWLVVCDKGTDRILTFAMGARLTLARTLQMGPETAPRHVAFSPDGRRMVATLELASELAAFDFDTMTGALSLTDRVPTTAGPLPRVNEPAEVRLQDGLVYVNNRGEDSLAWFTLSPEGRLMRQGHVPLAPSVHPGLAARSFALTQDRLILADRPADPVRLYHLDQGRPVETGTIAIPQPAFVALAPKEQP